MSLQLFECMVCGMKLSDQRGSHPTCPDAFCGASCRPVKDHEVVGHTFKAWDGKTYLCDSYDERIGFWMTEIGNPNNRRNVSERAIGGAFRRVA